MSRYLDLEVPEYGGDVVVRYRRLTIRELAAVERRARRGPQADERLLLDTVIAACHEILFRDAGQLKPLAAGQRLRFNADLARALELDATSPHEVVMEFMDANATVDHVRMIATNLR